MMHTWLSSLLHANTPPAPRLTISVYRRDALVYQGQPARMHTFSIGRSLRCTVPMDVPSVNYERFTLVQFRAGQPFIHFTDMMGGALHTRGEHLTLSSLPGTPWVQPAPQGGYRLALPLDASCHMCLDGWLLRFEWQEASASLWSSQLPLTSVHSRALVA